MQKLIASQSNSPDNVSHRIRWQKKAQLIVCSPSGGSVTICAGRRGLPARR
jgi:hypothetical protein